MRAFCLTGRGGGITRPFLRWAFRASLKSPGSASCLIRSAAQRSTGRVRIDARHKTKRPPHGWPFHWFGGGGGITRPILGPRPSGRRAAAFGGAPGAARRPRYVGSLPTARTNQMLTTEGDHLVFMVEAAGIEPASVSPPPAGSTCVVCLRFSPRVSDRQECQRT